jgi:ATP-dependent Clp protease ATP-binding subunit ClpX
VREPKRVLERLMVEGEKQEAKMLADAARQWPEAFAREHGIEIVFDDSALRRLVERAQTERMNMNDLCAHLFKDYQFGLSLLKKNTGQAKFVLNAEAVDAPDRCLSELVVQSYYPGSPSRTDTKP